MLIIISSICFILYVVIVYYHKLDITCISCDSLNVWLQAKSRFVAMVSSLSCMTVGPASDSMTTLT